MNIFKMEVKNSQLARFGVVCYITQLVLLIAGIIFTNVFNVLDILVLGLFLYFARKAAKSTGNITVHFYLYFVYWLLSLLTGAFGAVILLPLSGLGIIDMALHPDHAPAVVKWLVK